MNANQVVPVRSTKFSWMSDEELLSMVQSDDGCSECEVELAARLAGAIDYIDDLENESAAMEKALTPAEDKLHGYAGE